MNDYVCDKCNCYEADCRCKEAEEIKQFASVLQMVLMFFDSGPFDTSKQALWYHLQMDAGIQEPKLEITTRVLCDTIRKVLGVQSEKV